MRPQGRWRASKRQRPSPTRLAEEKPAGAGRAWKLGVSPGEPLLHIERLRVSFLERFAPGLLEHPLEGSLYDLLADRSRTVIDQAQQSVTRASADALGPKLVRILGPMPRALGSGARG